MANELKWWFKRFWCWITGGHIYKDINWKTEHFPEHCVTCFCNKCLKCGKSKVIAVKDEALYCGTPLATERIKVDFDGK